MEMRHLIRKADVIGVDGFAGHTTEQNSGGMFALKRDPVTGDMRKIKLNKLRFSEEKGMAEFIYKLVVEFSASQGELSIDRAGNIVMAGAGASNRIGISAAQLLSKIVNYGDRTIVQKKDEFIMSHLIPKQFFRDGNILIFGTNSLDISNPSSISEDDKSKLTSYIS